VAMPARPRKRRPIGDVVVHILQAIEQIEQFTAGMDFDAFLHDTKTYRAVERCLEIVSEASRDFPDEMKSAHTEIEWQRMADAGNIYRHLYEGVDAVMVWRTAKDHLPPLKAVVVTIKAKLDQGAP
jgi:uncharacterized protein with HEPN domain